jgi:hypothetical protein
MPASIDARGYVLRSSRVNLPVCGFTERRKEKEKHRGTSTEMDIFFILERQFTGSSCKLEI